MSSYAGEITPKDAWTRLADEPAAKLVDVRSQAEWNYVGVPDLSDLDKQAVLIAWQVYPGMTVNDAFLDQMQAQGIEKTDTVLLLCRSGVRSKAAAEFLTANGYHSAWNITHGFEGPLDMERHRGAVAGWQASGLPWIQS